MPNLNHQPTISLPDVPQDIDPKIRDYLQTLKITIQMGLQPNIDDIDTINDQTNTNESDIATLEDRLDELEGTPSTGDIIYCNNGAGPDWERLPIGTVSQSMQVSSSGKPEWTDDAKDTKAIVDDMNGTPTAGDIIYYKDGTDKWEHLAGGSGNKFKAMSLTSGGLPEWSHYVPIGTVLSWLKSYTNTPALPNIWVECNGQTLSDSDSVYNGQTIPDLNGNNYFLRGNSTSGGIGGTDTVTLTAGQSGLPSHTHDWTAYEVDYGGSSGSFSNHIYGRNLAGSRTPVTNATGGTSASSSHENKPPYYDVVWIMKVK